MARAPCPRGFQKFNRLTVLYLDLFHFLVFEMVNEVVEVAVAVMLHPSSGLLEHAESRVAAKGALRIPPFVEHFPQLLVLGIRRRLAIADLQQELFGIRSQMIDWTHGGHI